MQIEAINTRLRAVVLDDGSSWPIEIFLDGDGDECEIDVAKIAICGPCIDGNGREFWMTAVLSEFEVMMVQ